MKRNLYLGAGVVLLILLVGGGYWYYFSSIREQAEQQARNEYLEAYRKASAVHHSGTYDESIAAFEELLPQTPTQATATQVKFVIASDLFARNRGDDRARAVEMYKEIILDQGNYPFQRAVAVSELIGLIYGTHDANLTRMILQGEPFEKFADEARSLNYRAINDYAIRRALEMGEELYPLAMSEFRITDWYSGALASGLVRDEAQRAELVAELKRWTEKGEKNVPAIFGFGYEQTRIAEVYQRNGGARWALARYGDGEHNYDLAETAFQNALQALAADPGPHTFGVGMFVRFHYAAMLAAVYGEERRAGIEELMGDIVNVPAEFRNRGYIFYEFLKNEMSSEHNAHGHKQDLVRLSQMVPEFRAFLEARGIRY